MTKNTLPRSIDPLQLADRGASLQGEVAIKDMSRLVTLLKDKKGNASFSLKFGKDSQGFRTICGKIHAPLILECQRCLQPMAYTLDLEVKLSPLLTEKGIDLLPNDFEPLLVTGEPILLSNIIEDELLLNLPLVPKHRAGERCIIQYPKH